MDYMEFTTHIDSVEMRGCIFDFEKMLVKHKQHTEWYNLAIIQGEIWIIYFQNGNGSMSQRCPNEIQNSYHNWLVEKYLLGDCNE